MVSFFHDGKRIFKRKKGILQGSRMWDWEGE